jgi:uncharacterized protein
MLFKPKNLPPWKTRLRVALWPRRSFARSLRYVSLRVMRLAGSPHGLAVGVAVGVFIATLPIPGAQMLLAAGCAWMLGGNVPAALLGTFWANPITLPVLWLSSHWLGQQILGGQSTFDGADVMARLSRVATSLFAPGGEALGVAYAALWPVLKPLAIGSTLLGAVSAFLFYWLTLHLIAGYREERRKPPAVDRETRPVLPLNDFSSRMT